MRSTRCALGVVGECRELLFILATVFGSRTCGRLGTGEKIILKLF
jgi:hypothetical protein